MSKTILIVEDSASIRQEVSITLKGAGYDVIEGCDGTYALSKLDGRKIHLIVSDVYMPNMDGLSFVKAAKLLPAYKFAPVTMLTTEARDAIKQQGQASGAKAWMAKPFQPTQMLTAVSKLTLP